MVAAMKAIGLRELCTVRVALIPASTAAATCKVRGLRKTWMQGLTVGALKVTRKALPFFPLPKKVLRS